MRAALRKSAKQIAPHDSVALEFNAFSSSAASTTNTKQQLPLPKSKWNANTSLLVTHPTLLLMESCATMLELKQIQAHMTRTGLIFDAFPASRVLAFCALSHLGDIHHARLLFAHQIRQPNTFMWNTMIRGYCRTHIPVTGFSCFREMARLRDSVDMDKQSFVSVLKVCEQFPRIPVGESVHCWICKVGFVSDVFVRNGLIHFYSEAGDTRLARQVFDQSPERDVISWTSMIHGYVQQRFPDEALKLFDSMRWSGIAPNEITTIAVLSACSQKGDLSRGEYIHGFIEMNVLKNCSSSLNLTNALVDMYVKCGCLSTARAIFDKMEEKDVFSWTSMINGYAKHGDLEIAKDLFDKMPHRNVVSWNAMIAGYSQNNLPKEALDLFHDMVAAGLVPIESTLVCVLSACAQSGILDLGRWVHHHYVNQNRVRLSVSLANAIMDMYAKCGCIDAAAEIFNLLPERQRDLVSWNTMIVAYAVHGHAKLAVTLFEHMTRSVGIKPDDITLVGVLSACSHGGLANKGWEYFRSMDRDFGLNPKVEHYACMIDMLGRLGLLEEAYQLLTSMPMEADKAAWGALLNACKMHGNLELGKFAANKLQDMDPKDGGIYVLLAALFAKQRRWDDVRTVRSVMRGRGIKKTPGCSLIEVEGESHEFVVADESHPLSEEIYRVLKELTLLYKAEEKVQRLKSREDMFYS